jgi:hypothetical protein
MSPTPPDPPLLALSSCKVIRESMLITDWQKKLLPIFKNLKIGKKI